MNSDMGVRHARRFAQESAFALIGLNKMHVRHPHDRQHKTWKARTAAKIDKNTAFFWNIAVKLRRIQHMPAP